MKNKTMLIALSVLLAVGVANVSAASADNYTASASTAADQSLNNAPMNNTSITGPERLDNNVFPGGRSRNGITANPINGPDVYSNGANFVQVKRLDDNSIWSSNSKVSFQGEIVSIDKVNNQIVVRNDNGATGFYNVRDARVLNDLQQGDRVRIVY